MSFANQGNSFTVVGNLVDDPEMRYTPNGKPVTNFRLASTPRRYNSQTQQWEDGEALFITVNLWGKPAENFAASCAKGDRVVAVGNLKMRSYENREGEKRTVIELEAEEVAASLKFASASLAKGGGFQQQGGGFQQQGGGFQQQNQQGSSRLQAAQQNMQQGFPGAQQTGGFPQQHDDPWGDQPNY